MTSPIDGPVPHVYVDLGDGRCVCGAARFTGVHVAPNCGHPESATVSAVLAELDALHADQADRLAKVRGMLLGGWAS